MNLDRHAPAAKPKPPRLTFRQQRERTRQLDELRIKRGLTPEERAEADDLALKLYHRIMRLG